MLRNRFPKLEIVRGSLSDKDGPVQKAIARSDFFLRGPGMGQSTDFMKYCRSVGKPYGFQGQSYFPDMVNGPGAEERIELLNGASFIFTRETKTRDILKAAGVTKPELYSAANFAASAGVFLRPPPPTMPPWISADFRN